VLPPNPSAAAAPAPKTNELRQPRESDDLATALQRRGDLNLHGLTLNAALFAIGEQWNINIVAGEVEGKVNGVFKQAPLREILDAILLSNGYNYRAVGKSLVVSKSTELGQTSPFFESATIPVRTADIDEVVEVAKLLNTPQGQVKALKSARAIVVLDFPDRVEMIRKFVSANDGGSNRLTAPNGQSGPTLDVAYFRTHFVTARAVEQALQAVLSKDGRVGIMEQEDRLIVADYAENLAMVEKVLARIDQPRPQVRITALIYDISLQDIEQLGLNWNKFGYHSGDNGFAVGIHPVAPTPLEFETSSTVAAVEGATVAFGALTRHFDINGVLLALQKANDARLLADPNVLVIENQQAVFKSVREIPIQQLTETQQGGNIGTTAFKEAGITLTVVPKIAYDGTICMDVSPEFSRLVGFDSNGQPIIDTRQAKSTLRVANRQTVVIGGLRQRDDIGEFNAIPYLGDMKFLGRLFRARDTTVRESELVVFIMPEIVACPAPEPCYRQGMVEETVRCRLDQIPQAEGCPPFCRRLPPEMVDEEVIESAPADSSEEMPAHVESDAAYIPSSECQFGVAGRSEHVRTMVADGRLRRLPSVNPARASAGDDQIRTAQVPASTRHR
jgi:general secretion pathway protein D